MGGIPHKAPIDDMDGVVGGYLWANLILFKVQLNG